MSTHHRARPSAAHRLAAFAAALLSAVGLVVALDPPAGAATSLGGLRYAVAEPVCAQPADPAAVRCFALRRVTVAKGTPGAVAYRSPAAAFRGPAGGYTPAALAKAYGYNPDIDRSTTTVAAVLWGHYPTALADLDEFDQQYGLPAETSTSFRQVSQRGGTDYPAADTDSAGEEALDIQALRAVCHTCRILLVEADSYNDADLAVAENYAAAHALGVSNSWGGNEYYPSSAALVRSFVHPGVAITVSTGDDGWYDWNQANYDRFPASAGRGASYPATDAHVIAVSGTTLRTNASGARTSETVWNSNGHEDETVDSGLGAAGGGCSHRYAAAAWQRLYPGYSKACAGKRLSADVSAVADPSTGFDVYLSYGAKAGEEWGTIGGTSLSSPLIAGMIALAGGARGVAYPSSTIYANARRHPGSVHDITVGGTGFCDGHSIARCSANSKAYFDQANPNAIVGRRVDCSWKDAKASTRPTAVSRECNAATGYDGATGVGTPHGLGLFAPVAPTVGIAVDPSRTTAAFAARVTEPVAGIAVRSTRWTFGDGTTSASAAPKHTYRTAGTYTVTVSVTNSQRQTATHTSRVTVGRAPEVVVHGGSAVSRDHAHAYSAVGSHSTNTGGHVASVTWRWGDGTRSTGAHTRHTWTRAGHYTVLVTVRDTAGYSRTVSRTVTVG